MRDLPTGTVSMLFSDIEGSTLLLTRLGRTTEALDRHRRLLRSAWAASAGTEMGTEGDSFFVVFPTADGAVRQQCWPSGAQSQAWQRRADPRAYRHPHRDAAAAREATTWDGRAPGRTRGRSCSWGSGRAHVGDSRARRWLLPEDVWLKDLGTHHLKDLPEPERVFQLAIEGLQEDFPPSGLLGRRPPAGPDDSWWDVNRPSRHCPASSIRPTFVWSR